MIEVLEVLHVPGCPTLPGLLRRLREVTELPVVTREIRSTAEAEAAGMAGSPTLLVDGRDPFRTAGGAGRACGMACRIHRDEQGRAVPVPSIAQLRSALRDIGFPARRRLGLRAAVNQPRRRRRRRRPG